MDQATNLRNIIKKNTLLPKKRLARVITVTSGKGGVGKSNITINLAINLIKKGKRVIIFDADFGLANIEVIFGIVPKYNLFDMIYKGMDIVDILTSGPMDIEFISGGSGISELANLSEGQLAYLNNNLEKLDNLADIILIDTGAGISDTVLDFILKSNEVLLVTTPEPTSITDAYALMKILRNRKNFEYKKTPINLVVNQVSNDAEGLETYNKLNTVANRFLDIKLNNIGFLPHDNSITKAVIKQKPVSILYPKSKITKAFEELANNVIEHKSYHEKKGVGLRSVFSSLIK